VSDKGTILKQLMWNGAFAKSASVALRMTRSKFCGLRRPMFEFSPPSDVSLNTPRRPDYVIQRVPSRSELNPALFNELPRMMEREEALRLDRLFEEGAILWVGRFKGQLANVGWSRTGDRVRLWFFPLAPHWVVLSHFLTLPAFRGRGLYPHMMRHIVAELAAGGCNRFFIDCADWNLPSVQGIRKAGFKQIGYGLSRCSGQLVWHPEPRE
jgi:RimJ/RimL family protein N-acetyltransferase